MGSLRVRGYNAVHTQIIASGDDRLSGLGHHAQIAIAQFEMCVPALAPPKMNPLEAADSDGYCVCTRREFQIELQFLVARQVASIRHRHGSVNRTLGVDRCSRQTEAAVGNGCVTQAVPDG